MIDIIYFDRKTADALRSVDVKEPGGATIAARRVQDRKSKTRAVTNR